MSKSVKRLCLPVYAEGPAAASSAAEPKAEAAAEQDEPMSMDEIVERCLLGGLLAVPETELPLMASDFYTKYMLPCRPPGELFHPCLTTCNDAYIVLTLLMLLIPITAKL